MRELAALAQAIRPPRAPANATQLASRSYRVTATDQDFPLGGSMRGALHAGILQG